jgi:hypothetical protein
VSTAPSASQATQSARAATHPRHTGRHEPTERGHVREDERGQERQRGEQGAGYVAGGPPDLGQVARRRELRLQEDEDADVAAQLNQQLRDGRSLVARRSLVLRFLVLSRESFNLIGRLGHDLPP